MGEVLAPRLLNITEAARYLGCPVRSVRDLYWRGQLRFVHIGKRFLFDVRDLDSLVETLKESKR